MGILTGANDQAVTCELALKVCKRLLEAGSAGISCWIKIVSEVMSVISKKDLLSLG